MTMYYDIFQNSFIILWLDDIYISSNYTNNNFLLVNLKYSCCSSKFIFNYNLNFTLNYNLNIFQTFFFFINVIVYQ